MLRSQRKKEIIWCIFQEFNRIKTSVHRNLLVQIKPRGSPHRLWIGCIRMWWRWWKWSKCCRVSEQTSGRSWGTKTTPLKAEEQRGLSKRLLPNSVGKKDRKAGNLNAGPGGHQRPSGASPQLWRLGWSTDPEGTRTGGRKPDSELPKETKTDLL